jgi:hypothetical protein
MVETFKTVHIKDRIFERSNPTMKKRVKRNDKIAEERQEELQSPNSFSYRDNEQPQPQPKDYEEIEY